MIKDFKLATIIINRTGNLRQFQIRGKTRDWIHVSFLTEPQYGLGAYGSVHKDCLLFASVSVPMVTFYMSVGDKWNYGA